ncbi:MAG: ArnT family glycosyltransferase [Sphingomonadaceae bacterium]
MAVRSETSILVVVVSSSAGALVVPVSRFGAASPFSVGQEWLLPMLGWWAFLVAWAMGFASLLRRSVHLSRGRSLQIAACCHVPLLLCLVLVAAVYGDQSFAQGYVSSQVGRQLFQPLVRDMVLLAPLSMQAATLAILRWRDLSRHWAIVAILLVSLALRLWNGSWGLPGLLHPDEHRYIGPATMMVARGDLNPHYFENPSLMIYLTALLFWALTEHSIAFHTADQFFNLCIPDPRGDFLQMVALRGVSALAGTLTVLVVYLTAMELKRERSFALASAAFLAVSLLHVRNSHYGTNDILATLFLAASFLFAVRIFTVGRPRDYLMAGLLGGLGASTKYNAGIFAVAIVGAHLIRTLEMRGGSRWRHLLLPTCGLVSLVAFLLGTPYALLDCRSFLAGFMAQSGYGASPWYGQEAESTAMAFLESVAQGFGVIPLLLAAAGALLAMRRHPMQTLLLLSTPLTYFLFMSGQRLFFARFAIPLLPYLAVLAGYGIVSVGRVLGSAPGGRAVPLLLLAVALLQPTLFSVRHNLLLGEVDTRVWTAAWIDERLPKDSSLAMESYAHLDVKFGWKGHQLENTRVYWPDWEKGIATALSGEHRYIVVSSFGYGPLQGKSGPPSQLPHAYKPLEERGKLIAHFGPGPRGSDIPYALDDMYTPFWHLFDRMRPGPSVRIYEMPVATRGDPP